MLISQESFPNLLSSGQEHKNIVTDCKSEGTAEVQGYNLPPTFDSSRAHYHSDKRTNSLSKKKKKVWFLTPQMYSIFNGKEDFILGAESLVKIQSRRSFLLKKKPQTSQFNDYVKNWKKILISVLQSLRFCSFIRKTDQIKSVFASISVLPFVPNKNKKIYTNEMLKNPKYSDLHSAAKKKAVDSAATNSENLNKRGKNKILVTLSENRRSCLERGDSREWEKNLICCSKKTNAEWRKLLTCYWRINPAWWRLCARVQVFLNSVFLTLTLIYTLCCWFKSCFIP